MSDPARVDLGGNTSVAQSRIERMNSGVLRLPGHTVFVDPGVLPAEIAALARGRGDDRTLILLTHHHWDHVLGPARLPGAETAAHPAFADCLVADLSHARTAIAAAFAEHHESVGAAHVAFVPTHHLDEGRFGWGPYAFDVLHVPGHARDAVALRDRGGGVLFAGDLLSDIEPPWLEGPARTQRASLERLQPLAFEARALVPGHGTPALGRAAIAARFAADLGYLDALENGVRDAHARGLELQAAVARLESLGYPGRDDASHSTMEVHRANVRHVWADVASPPPQ